MGGHIIEEAALDALATIFTLKHMSFLCGGVALGLVVGVLPGLGGSAGLALLLPFVFGMEPSHALAMMIGLLSVVATSDTFPSVLMGIPGSAGSQATVMDGFPLAKKGEGIRALAAAFSASMIGGLFGALVLTFAIFFAEPVIRAMGFGELMMLIILALTMVGMLTGSNALRGIASCFLGLMIGAMGSAPATGIVRLTFGSVYLIEPVPVVIVGLGMFAIPEIIDLIRRSQAISETGSLGSGWAPGIADTIRHWWIVLRCSAIGCLLGALPGLGGTVIDWIAYSHVMQTTKNNRTYGSGDIRGVIAPESANNAKEGGALIPTLLFGIPGSSSMALLLGGFILIGLQPGLRMVTTDLNLVYLMVWSLAIANIVGAGACILLAPQISRLTTVRYALIAPFMIGVIYFAAFQSTRDWGDLVALTILGVLGVYMKRFGWSRPALLIGFVLAAQLENGIYHTVAVYGLSFLERPIVLTLMVVIAFSIYAGARYVPHRPERLSLEGVHAPQNYWPQLIFMLLLIGFALLLIVDTKRYGYLTSLYPLVVGVGSMLFMVPLVVMMLVTKKPSTIFYDEKREQFGRAGGEQSLERSLGWLLALLGMSAAVGFVLGVAAFIFCFLRSKARLNHSRSALAAILFVAFLGVLSRMLTLRYPEGLLQDYLTLPWPLQ